MKTIRLMGQNKAILGAVLLSLGLAALVHADKGSDDKSNNNNNNNTEARLTTKLTGAAIKGVEPKGTAEFRSKPSRGRMDLTVEVGRINLPADTLLTVAVQLPKGAAVTVGNIKLNASGSGELELETEE